MRTEMEKRKKERKDSDSRNETDMKRKRELMSRKKGAKKELYFLN